MAAMLIGTMAVTGPAMAASFEAPAFITSAGQSPGALMVRVLADQAGLEREYDATGGPESLDGAKSFIVVIGASMKGLGAAGIDVDDEFARIEAMLNRARELGIPVLAMHVEGAPRRGATSDDLTELVFAYADYAIVRADGDDDGFFTNLAKAHDVTLEKVDATAQAAAVLRTLFGN